MALYKEIRLMAYSVLLQDYPNKLSASEIAKRINKEYGIIASRQQVHGALRVFARMNRHFAIYPSFFPYRIRYSVYPFEGPFVP